MKLRTLLIVAAVIAVVGVMTWGAMRVVKASAAPSASQTPTTRVKRGSVTVTESVAWEGTALVVRSSAAEGRSTTESFSVSDDGRLVHSLTLPGRDRGEERTLRWVYDRVEAKGTRKKS